MNGHGTHTLSIAAGRFVDGANVFGLANGTAKGGASNARVAAYKVCWSGSPSTRCVNADIMAALDAAIHDGVDVLSLSLGGTVLDYKVDGIAIGSFHAAMKGIPVVCSAGNEGPIAGKISNVAPWMITVGASTIDRVFTSYVELGNKLRFKGQSLSSTSLPAQKLFPLISGIDAKIATAPDDKARQCMVGTLDPTKVKGKIMVCVTSGNLKMMEGLEVSNIGGIGMILVNDEEHYYEEVFAEPHLLPMSYISTADGVSLFAYIRSTESPVAYITPPTTEMGVKPAPTVASFSSPGPNSITPEILKPDIIAPGVGVIAAFSKGIGPSELPWDQRRVPFNIMSGTSMSCPHVSGIVALLRKLHPDWSPAAIKSAIMTTARIQSNTKKPILDVFQVKANPFKYGAGHVWPNRAMDPGLVYDLRAEDYLNFLCGIGYNEIVVSKFKGKPHICPKSVSLLDFNYPAITIPQLYGNVTIKRTVKNVGSPGTYHVQITEPPGVSVMVEPKSLKFGKIGKEKSFKVTMTVRKGWLEEYAFGKLVWSDGVHHVTSPISIMEGF